MKSVLPQEIRTWVKNKEQKGWKCAKKGDDKKVVALHFLLKEFPDLMNNKF